MHVNATACIDLGFLSVAFVLRFDCCVRVLENDLVEFLVPAVIPGDRHTESVLNLDIIVMERFQVLSVIRVEKIETEAKTDH